MLGQSITPTRLLLPPSSDLPCLLACLLVCVSVTRLPTGTAIPWRSPSSLWRSHGPAPALGVFGPRRLRWSVSSLLALPSAGLLECSAYPTLASSTFGSGARPLRCSTLGHSGAWSLRRITAPAFGGWPLRRSPTMPRGLSTLDCFGATHRSSCPALGHFIPLSLADPFTSLADPSLLSRADFLLISN